MQDTTLRDMAWRDISSLFLAVLVLASVSPKASGFSQALHEDLTKVLTVGTQEYFRDTSGEWMAFTEAASNDIADANSSEDGPIDVFVTVNHFDNEDLDSWQRLRDKRTQIVEKLIGFSPDPEGARELLGEALHTVQDFYSHSTWVESHGTSPLAPLGLEANTVVPFGGNPCTGDGNSLATPVVLTTGFFAPNNAYIRGKAVGERKCVHGGFPNANYVGIHKDREGQERPLHPAAYSAAADATVQYVKNVIADLVAMSRPDAVCDLLGYADTPERCASSPSVTLSASLNRLPTGEETLLTWTSSNAVTCTAADGAPGDGWAGDKDLSGSQNVTTQAAGTYTYRITCLGSDSATVLAEVSVEFTSDDACANGGPNCRLVGAELTVLDSVAGWTGLPGTISVSSLVGPSNSYLGSNPAQCPFGEQGGPVWSSFVTRPATFWRADVTSGVPYNTILPNARPCSSFIAIRNQGQVDANGNSMEEIWINATTKGRRFTQFGQTSKEYQVRYYSGLPGQPESAHAELGSSLNEGNYFREGGVLQSVTVRLIYELVQ